MSMPFYVSPEQIMKDQADYARKGIARGRSSWSSAVRRRHRCSSRRTRRRALHKICEIYDRIALRRRRQVQRVREPAGRGRPATPTCAATPTTARDVTARGLANAYAQTLGTIFTTEPSRYEVELVVAEVGPTPADDQIYRLTYDGSVADEHGYVAMGGSGGADRRGAGGALARRAEPGRGARARRRACSARHGGRGEPPASSRRRSWRSRCWTARARAARSGGSPGSASRTARGCDDDAADGARDCSRGADRRRGRVHADGCRPGGRWTGGSSGSRPSTASPARSEGSARLSPDEVARYLFRKVVVLGPLAATCSCATAPGSTSTSARHPEYATAGVRRRASARHARPRGGADPRGPARRRRAAAARGGHRRRRLPVQEQHRLRRQLLRLPRELPGAPPGRVRPARPTCSSRSSSPARSSPAPARCCRRRAARCTACRQRADHIWEGVSSATTRSPADHQHPRRAARRRRAATAGCTSSSATRTCPRPRRCSRSARTDLVLRMIEAGVVDARP